MYGFILRVLGVMSAELCCRSRVWFVSFYTVKCQGPAGLLCHRLRVHLGGHTEGRELTTETPPKLLFNNNKKTLTLITNNPRFSVKYCTDDT